MRPVEFRSIPPRLALLDSRERPFNFYRRPEYIKTARQFARSFPAKREFY
jgi:hypothetical protein